MPKRTNDGLSKRCGCSKRQWPKCRHPWHVGFHHGGREYRYSLDKVARARNEQPPATKGEAVSWRDRVRGEIRTGTFVDPDAPVVTPAPTEVETRLTFGDVCDRYRTVYVDRYLRPRTAEQAAYHLAILRRVEIPAPGATTIRLETKPFDAILKADVEAVREARRPLGIVGCNRLLARLRHLFNWAIGEGYVDRSPFKRESVTVVKLEMAAETARTRRLAAGEEDRLLQQAPPFVRALLVAALSTGCRVGELLALRWSQIRRDASGVPCWLILAAEDTKTHTSRSIPIGPRLRAELEMRRQAPDGREHPADAYIFGNAVGERVAFPKLAWMTTVLKAHGIAPIWDGTRHTLSTESRTAFRAIGLHFHDVRREFACRLRESGASDHDVRDFLGHANISTTSRYLRSTPDRLAQALARMEEDVFAQDSHTGADPVDASADVVSPNVVN